MTPKHFTQRPLGIALCVAIANLALPAQQAHAQEDAAGTTTLDRIEVTGSRIRKAEIETAQPVTTLTREDIEQQGFTSVADILQNLTSTGSPAISRSMVLASGENVGGSYVDLRNLGPQRVLVLVNGKRLGVTTSGLQDLAQIPVSAISRIDVLKDGASATYGSDAIAGVINVITRSDFDGFEANAYHGQFGQGDGTRTSYDATMGFSGERGSLTVSAEYAKEEPVFARDRDFSAHGNAGPDYPGSGASPVSQNGSFCDPCSPTSAAVWYTLIPGMDPRDRASYRVHTAAFNANSNQQMMVQSAIERRSLFVNGVYDFTDTLRLRADMLYTRRGSQRQIAGYPYQSAAFGTPMSGDSYFNPMPGEDLTFRRRLWEKPRTSNSNLETWRVAAGLEGAFRIGDRDWDWDIGALFNENNVNVYNNGDASLVATAAALGPSWFNPATNRVECGSAGAPVPYGSNLAGGECVPWNPLVPFGAPGANSLADPTVQAFLFPEYHDTGRTRTRIYTANLGGSLFTLPAGDVSLAVGLEHRREEGRFVPDAFNRAGLNTGLPADITAGGYDLDEAYLEIEVPILADAPMARELSVNLASRYSDYSNFGDTTNSKFSLRWRPVEGLLVRGVWSQGFRAPSINDLYGGIGGSFESYSDPCSVLTPNHVNGGPACNAAGAPPGYVQLGQGLVPCTTLPCQTPDQFLSGSNADLTPEMATTRTAGLVWSPQRLRGLDITLDWYNVKLRDTIAEDGVDAILRDCYVLQVASRCAGITRAADGHINNLFFGLVNLGALEAEGWDLGINYRLPELPIGRFSINWQSSYTSRFDTRVDDAPDTPTVGNVGSAGTTTVFRLRSNVGVNWKKGMFGVNYMARHYSGLRETCVANRPCTDPDRYANGEPAPARRVGSNTFHDVQFTLDLPWNATAALGANNAGEHYGPIMFTAPVSNFPYYGGFDIGRFVYMKYQQRF